ncbi:hypothetical protein BGZ83_011028 [Gryganskiella cystojenkinii]|nr:hypothetical protein BGZ83_011028 [Gryganskiella cystojenkinii]
MEHTSMETYYGLIKTPHDALIIFEGKVHRRLSDIERQSVRSGSVYCFDEREAGMRRWTDGKSWSPSRVTGSFLTYRELDESGSHGGKNVYRADGLLKQSFSITTSDNKKLHLISYYTNEDVASEQLTSTPTRDPKFINVVVPKGVYPETTSTAEALTIQASMMAAMGQSSSTATAPSASPTLRSSPSPTSPHRPKHRLHHRSFSQQKEMEPPRNVHNKAEPAAAPMVSNLKEHRYSPMQSNDHKHGQLSSPSSASRSRSNSHNAVAGGYHPYGLYGPGPEKRYKSSSPSVASSFPTPPSNVYSPAASWASEEYDQPLVAEMETVTPAESTDGQVVQEEIEEEESALFKNRNRNDEEGEDLPHKRPSPLLISSFDLYKNASSASPTSSLYQSSETTGGDYSDRSSFYALRHAELLKYHSQQHQYYDHYTPPSDQAHEQDSLSVLANLATTDASLLLPKIEPKEFMTRERSRWVEDDRQLRALSSMLRL